MTIKEVVNMTIKEVSDKYDVTADTLRYYEKVGLIEKVTRKDNGNRSYQESDLSRIEFILCMRATGLSISALQEYIALFHEGDDTIEQRKEILLKQNDIVNEKIAELEKLKDRIEYKIKNYDEKLLKREKVLLIKN